MTKEILERYFNGAASEDEQEVVRQWLGEANINAPLINKLTNEQKDTLGKDIWKGITAVTDKRTGLKQIRPIVYKVAASVAVVIIGGALFFKNTSSLGKGPEAEKLNIRSASYNITNHFNLDQNGTLTFCGDMEISNQGSSDYSIVLKTTCKETLSQEKKFLSKKGHSYIAVLFKHKNNEIVVIDKEELRRETQPLPRQLITKLTKEFTI